jgi:gluconolactonase
MSTMGDAAVREVVTGLRFPEGPVAMADGSVVLVEIARGTVTRVQPDGSIAVVADGIGGPNGLAVGPDGAIYIADNGGYFAFSEFDGQLFPGGTPDEWTGGRIARLDLASGQVTTLFTECDGVALRAPNDLVFDTSGGFWFTDHGVTAEHPDRPGVLYARADGTHIAPGATGVEHANGVGLSPAGNRLYVAETYHGRVWQWAVSEPGVLAALDESSPSGGQLLFDAPDGHLFDSLAVDGDGNVCVGTLGQGGITVIHPDTGEGTHVGFDDPLVTNICFADPSTDPLAAHGHATAFLTASATGRLLQIDWPHPGLALAHQG